MYYTAKQLIAKAKESEGYEGIPEGYWICCIRMNEEDRKPNQFNDVLNLMEGSRLVLSTTCTTVPGLPALKGGFRRYNKKGAAVAKSNVWMIDAFSPGYHFGSSNQMKALRQVKDIFAYRDGDMDDIAEQLGTPVLGMWNTNIHASTYNILNKIRRLLIKGWSYGCIVCNYRPEYNTMIKLTEDQKFISAIVLDEFSL